MKINNWEDVFKFNNEQLSQIRLGIQSNVNIDIYANPEFNYEQMMKSRVMDL